MNEQARLRNVDVLVGGQYGSEGKGNIAAKIAPRYDVLVRTGGPNAGHTVIFGGGKRVFRHLPSGSLHNPVARIILGAGAVINPAVFFEELESTGVDPTRIIIDPQAVVIRGIDIDVEKSTLEAISSTNQGVGAASIGKMMRNRVNCQTADRHSELHRFVRPTLPFLQDPEMRVLVEGTQGVLLSLHHGDWPYVTSRDTSPSGVLAEAGIPPTRINRVIMAIRTFPIRVANPPGDGETSGPMSNECTWEQVAAISGGRYTGEDLRQREMTTTTKRQRRVAHFNMDQFQRAHMLCGPTDIAVTFCDYIHPANMTTFVRAIGFKVPTPITLLSSGPTVDDVEWKNREAW